MSKTRFGTIMLVVVSAFLLAFGVAADSHMGDESEAATVVINLSDIDAEFGNTANWEGSLYAGPNAGEETSGRFTEWVQAENGAVVFNLPEDVREGDSAPFEEENGTYIRVRSVGEDAYPNFDFVGSPFTLTYSHHVAQVGFQGVNTKMVGEEGTELIITLEDFREGFGAVQDWEASIYAGANAGDETSGRFTEWVVAKDGMVSFSLPEDVREGDELTYGEKMDTYIRVRSVGEDTYPSFDFVARPFTLMDGDMVETSIFITSVVWSQ